MKQPLTALISVVIVAAVAEAMATPQADPAAPAVKDVMATMTVPASDAVFSAASEPPRGAAQWVALQASAKTLAESGRLLTTTSRKDDPEWIEMARALVTEAEATLKVIETRNADALSQAGETLYVTCETCHARFMNR